MSLGAAGPRPTLAGAPGMVVLPEGMGRFADSTAFARVVVYFEGVIRNSPS